MPTQLKILIVNRNDSFRKNAFKYLKRHLPGARIQLVIDIFWALGKLISFQPDLIFLDLNQENNNYLYYFCQRAKELLPQTKIVGLTLFQKSTDYPVEQQILLDEWIAKENFATYSLILVSRLFPQVEIKKAK